MIVLFALAITTFFHCSNETKNRFTIKDFRPSLRPYLIKVISFGIVRSDSTTRFIQKHATDKELRQLSRCEHPLLRAVALRGMLQRASFNHFDVIMNNLADTAIIATNDWVGREGGTIRTAYADYSTVSDDMVRHGKWKDTTARNKTIEEIILRHPYLQSAYEKLLEIDPKETYYSSLKQMLKRDKQEDEELGIVKYKDFERAIYALAKFRKDENLDYIKNFLMEYRGHLSEVSYRLMQEFQIEAYLEVYEEIFPKIFYRRIRDEGLYSSNSLEFIRSVAVYKNQRSARILDSILHQEPFMSGVWDTIYRNYIRVELVLAIWDNPCAAYSKMRKQIESDAKTYEKKRNYLEHVTFGHRNSPEPISWDYD